MLLTLDTLFVILFQKYLNYLRYYYYYVRIYGTYLSSRVSTYIDREVNKDIIYTRVSYRGKYRKDMEIGRRIFFLLHFFHVKLAVIEAAR